MALTGRLRISGAASRARSIYWILQTLICSRERAGRRGPAIFDTLSFLGPPRSQAGAFTIEGSL